MSDAQLGDGLRGAEVGFGRSGSFAEVLRPGVARGAYPEKPSRRRGLWERHWVGLLGRISRRRESRDIELALRGIEHRGRALAQASDEALTTASERIRAGLTLKGMTREGTLAAFALIREQALRRLGVELYDVQLVAGLLMARGMLAEMATGEGKTLAATLPAATAAFAGIPVHVISSNDYLVSRDAEAMRPLYESLGLSVGSVTAAESDPELRRAAYACDVTYVTSNQVAFDYLKDRIASRSGICSRAQRGNLAAPQAMPLLLRGLCFAIVDEADSVLIDEARTPLILSRPSASRDEALIYKRALRLARGLDRNVHFRLDERQGRLELLPAGRERIAELARPLGGLWSGPRRREEWVERALAAEHLFSRDRHYLVRDGAIQIVDQLTGRLSPDRSWDRGLHQMIELKEGCPPTPENETLARISYQHFFRRYLRLSGMTGTAREVSRELAAVYGLQTVTVPSRLASRRCDLGKRVFASSQSRWAAVVERVREVHSIGRPVLVGTCSVAASEELSRLLAQAGLPHQVLNARQDASEAQIVARAGHVGAITVSTHMAGRGTDIPLGPGVTALGGLHVILTELAEAGRVDRQLIGRCARQGDPGSSEALLCLEDAQPARNVPLLLRRLAGLRETREISPSWLGRALLSAAQTAEERRCRVARKALMELEDYLDEFLGFSGV